MKKEAISVHDICKKSKNRLRIGTCSWNYPEWEKIGIYSTKQNRHYDYLPEYARHFNTAEVDQWFWSLDTPDSVRLPKKEDVAAYLKLTPDDFKFTVKAPNAVTLTHFYKQAPKQFAEKLNSNFLSQKIMDAFLKSIAPLQAKIGVIMLEFEYLNRQKMESLDTFFDHLGPFLDKLPDDYSYVIETRNPNFLKKEYFNFLKTHKTGHVFVEGYYMPPAYEVFEKFGRASITSNVVVVRLLGADRQAMEKKTGKDWAKIAEPRDEALKRISEFVSRIIPEKVDIYANFNNHLEGSAPLSISRFIDLLGN